MEASAGRWWRAGAQGWNGLWLIQGSRNPHEPEPSAKGEAHVKTPRGRRLRCDGRDLIRRHACLKQVLDDDQGTEARQIRWWLLVLWLILGLRGVRGLGRFASRLGLILPGILRRFRLL